MRPLRLLFTLCTREPLPASLAMTNHILERFHRDRWQFVYISFAIDTFYLTKYYTMIFYMPHHRFPIDKHDHENILEKWSKFITYSTDCRRGLPILGNIIRTFFFPKSVCISFQWCYPQKSLLYTDFARLVYSNIPNL